MRERYDIVSRPLYDPPQQQLAPYAPMPPALATALPSEAPEPSLIRPILRQWWLVLLFTVIGAAAAIAYIKNAQPLFTSQAKIYIQPTSGAVVDALGVAERSSYLSTQVEVIKSTPILNRVADTDGIRGMKTFLPAQGNPILFLREQLEVDLERKTDLIAISLSSPYPDEAAAIVSAVVDAYNAYCQEDRNTRNNQVLAALEQNKAEEDKAIAQMQQAVYDFKVRNPGAVLATSQGSDSLQAMTRISSSLTAARLQTIDARSTWGPNHPQVKKLEEKEAGFRNLYEDAKEKVMRENTKVAELQVLTSTLEEKTEFSRRLAERIHQLEIAMGGRKPINIDLVEPARVAEFPSFPRKNRTLAVALVAGALLGAGLALLRDRLDGRMRSVEEIQTVVGLPILGVVPAMSGRRTAVARAMTVHLDPRSVVAEAYRTIRTAVYFGTNGSRCKTILMTSPEPGDGKTTCASNLAIAIAQTGRSVLLLDADFRKPTQHKNLDIKDAVGLSSVLAGKEPLERAIQRTGVEGLDILPCGPIPANPSEILNSREFGELIDSLAGRYDHILFDSPPVNAVTDARILGAVCDATILVLRADKSTKKAGEHARNSLLSVGARVLGAIVNDAPRRKGYETYGGSYYGRADHGYAVPAARRLTAAVPQDDIDDDEGDQAPPRRRDIA